MVQNFFFSVAPLNHTTTQKFPWKINVVIRLLGSKEDI